MKTYYVTRFISGSKEMVIIYVSAENLSERTGLAPEDFGRNFLGVIRQEDTTQDAFSALDKEDGWFIQTYSDFQRDHAAKLHARK